MCVVDRARVSSSYFFLVLVSFTVSGYNGAETSCDSASSNLRIDTVTVRYINPCAVNVTWTPVSDGEDYTIQGYTVEYSSVSVMRVKGRCNGSAFFNHSGAVTSYGVIAGLSEEYDGYGFTVLIETNNETLGDDVTPVIGLRSNNINIITNSTTDPPADTSDSNGVPVETIVTVVACIIGTFILYTCVLVIIICCYKKSQIQIKRLKKEVMAVNELDFPNPATIGDASEYKVTPLYPLDIAISSSDHQSSATADGERESAFADKGESSVE